MSISSPQHIEVTYSVFNARVGVENEGDDETVQPEHLCEDKDKDLTMSWSAPTPLYVNPSFVFIQYG